MTGYNSCELTTCTDDQLFDELIPAFFITPMMRSVVGRRNAAVARELRQRGYTNQTTNEERTS